MNQCVWGTFRWCISVFLKQSICKSVHLPIILVVPQWIFKTKHLYFFFNVFHYIKATFWKNFPPIFWKSQISYPVSNPFSVDFCRSLRFFSQKSNLSFTNFPTKFVKTKVISLLWKSYCSRWRICEFVGWCISVFLNHNICESMQSCRCGSVGCCLYIFRSNRLWLNAVADRLVVSAHDQIKPFLFHVEDFFLLWEHKTTLNPPNQKRFSRNIRFKFCINAKFAPRKAFLYD